MSPGGRAGKREREMVRSDVVVSVVGAGRAARFRFRVGPGGVSVAGAVARGVPVLAVMADPTAVSAAAALARCWAGVDGVVHSRMVAGAHLQAVADGVHPSEHPRQVGGGGS